MRFKCRKKRIVQNVVRETIAVRPWVWWKFWHNQINFVTVLACVIPAAAAI